MPPPSTPDDPARPPVIDYLCNAFTPDRLPRWQAAVDATSTNVRIVSDPDDGFAEPASMVTRMDELGVETLLLPACDIGAHGKLDPLDYEHMACRWDEVETLAQRWPGRFAALAVVDPTKGVAGVCETDARLRDEWVAGLYVHTHSWDRRLDHADYYPYYLLAAAHDVPVVMQTGTSGGLMASECGHPISVDRPALYFTGTRFVLSHLGWPWTDEAVAMALKFPNVFLGTGAYPPRHWPESVRTFLRGPGRDKVLFGTNFPTVGHRRAWAQIDELDLTPEGRGALCAGTARRVFTRLSSEGATP